MPGLSVLDHCLDVGCVARAVVSNLPTFLQEALFLHFAGILAAAHDVGKVTPGFQSKCSGWLGQHGLQDRALRERWTTGCETDHAKVSQYAVQEHLTPGNDNLWAAAVGAHHGNLKGTHITGIAEPNAAWQEERHNLLKTLEGYFGSLPGGSPPEATLLAVAGLIVVADWIGSDATRFPFGRTETQEGRAKRCQTAIAELGLRPARFRPRLRFPDLFPGLVKPTELQRNAMEAIAGPGVYVIEGPMGCGKTEAALAAAYRLVAEGQATGIYFALPTQTTSNRIHLRLAPFVQAAQAETTHVRLAHGSSWLQDNQFLAIRASSDDTIETATAARSWFSSSKRALLAPVGVGTVDQALLGIVAAKHFFVRQFALAGKVVILDEIHTYDLYTSTLIDVLIRRLLELKCTVIVLSATLTRTRRETLLRAPSPSDSYPLLTGRGTERATATEIPVSADNVKTVRVQFMPDESLFPRALAAAKRGVCVLWIRNTVQESQETYIRLKSESSEGGPQIALLHARFPFFRREQLETEWMEKLGKDSTSRPANGCILVSTQVVEQSVDIDADLLITDIAPTDMLFQRMGRSWRHERGPRVCEQAIWIRDVGLSDSLRTAREDEIKVALGRSGKVYAPYVLVRTLEQWSRLKHVSVPRDIRGVLEATYVEGVNEPEAWGELRAELLDQMKCQQERALSATGVWSLPALKDEEGVQTRYSTLRTANLILAKRVDIDGHNMNIRFLDDAEHSICGPQFDYTLAKALHRNLVRVPAWCVRKFAGRATEWVKEYVSTPCVLGKVSSTASDSMPGLPVQFGETESGLYYREDLGIVIVKRSSSTPDGVLEDQSEDESND